MRVKWVWRPIRIGASQQVNSGNPALGVNTVWSQQQRRWRTHASSPAPHFGFAFDIDGVLLRSSAPLPGASKTLRYLQSQQIPFILLTNGGGKSEEQRVADINRVLGVKLDTSNFMQSHTPFRELVWGQPGGGEGLRDRNVLIVGGEGGQCRELAVEKYGFRSAITPADILLASPAIWPFSRPMLSHYESFARPLPQPIVADPWVSHSQDKLLSLSPDRNLQISTIMVFNDPRDWGLDATIILDLLLSHRGFVGTRSKLLNDHSLPNRGYQQDGQPSLWFSNPDLLWANAYHLPRLGQGGFREAFEGIWRAITDPDNTGDVQLLKKVIGKPYHETYSFAEKILNNYRNELLEQKHASESRTIPAEQDLQRVYMIGDNPAADIRGANEYNSPRDTKWEGILVKSGVYSEDEGPPRYEPRVIQDDVWSGVKWALEREGWDAGPAAPE